MYIQTKAGEKVVLVSGGGKDGDEKLIKGNTYGDGVCDGGKRMSPEIPARGI